MKSISHSRWTKAVSAVLFFSSLAASSLAQTAPADEPIHAVGFSGISDVTLPLVLEGSSPSMGHFVCQGEIRVASSRAGRVGTGAAIFRTDKGDRLVGTVSWTSDAQGSGEMTFDWKDSVTLADGTVSTSTGAFAKKKPGRGHGRTTGFRYITISIIAILIGL